ncbi:MAG: sigma-70 family RNA polymerase sigma factor [Thermodesulfobacteriota bacterium]
MTKSPSEPSPPEERTDSPETWVDLYGDALYRFALSRLKNGDLAEEMVQETFVAALHAYKNFKGRSALKTWLMGILKHKIIDHLRRKYRETPSGQVETIADNTDALFNEKGGWSVRPAKWSVNPGKSYEQREFLDVFYKCLADIPDRLAEAFTLREIDQLNTEELCKEMDISPTNSWTMLYRARMQLRRCLELNWMEGEGKE